MPKRMVIFILLFLLITFFFAAFIVNAAMFRPEAQPDANIDGRRVMFSSGRNRLAGYLWNEAGTRGLLVFAHGMGTGVEYYLPEIHHFAAQGYLAPHKNAPERSTGDTQMIAADSQENHAMKSNELLIENIDRLHTTPMGVDRIKKSTVYDSKTI